MKLKTTTLLALIGAVLSVCSSLFYFMVNRHLISYEVFDSIGWFFQLTNLYSSCAIFLFFYTLYKNQK